MEYSFTDGNGITGIPSAVFLMRWEEKMGIKKKKTFMQIVAVGHFLIFQKFLMTAKAMCLHIKVAQLKNFGWKRNYRHT